MSRKRTTFSTEFKTKIVLEVLKDDVKEYIEFYSYKRFHESLGYKKTNERLL